MNDHLAARLRQQLYLPDSVTDEEILRLTQGTSCRAWLELGMAFEHLGREIKAHLPAWIQRHLSSTTGAQ